MKYFQTMNIKISLILIYLILILFVILISGCESWNIQITRPGYDPGYHKQYPRLPHAFALVKNPHPVRYGEKSERFELRNGDCGDDDCYSPRYIFLIITLIIISIGLFHKNVGILLVGCLTVKN